MSQEVLWRNHLFSLRDAHQSYIQSLFSNLCTLGGEHSDPKQDLILSNHISYASPFIYAPSQLIINQQSSLSELLQITKYYWVQAQYELQIGLPVSFNKGNEKYIELVKQIAELVLKSISKAIFEQK